MFLIKSKTNIFSTQRLFAALFLVSVLITNLPMQAIAEVVEQVGESAMESVETNQVEKSEEVKLADDIESEVQIEVESNGHSRVESALSEVEEKTSEEIANIEEQEVTGSQAELVTIATEESATTGENEQEKNVEENFAEGAKSELEVREFQDQIENAPVLEIQDQKSKNETQISLNGKKETFENIKASEAYKYSVNPLVQITFNSLDQSAENPSFSIEETIVGKNGQVLTGYEFLTNMENGQFNFDLTLPNTAGGEAEIEYSENGGESFNSVEGEEKQNSTIQIKGLDHFTIFVVTNPNPVNNDCSGAGVGVVGTDSCYNTIQEAVDAATPGESISLESGATFNETVYINKSLTITSDGTATIQALADGSDRGDYGIILGEAVNDVTISNLNFTQGGISVNTNNTANGCGGVFGTAGTDNITITGNTFTNIRDIAINTGSVGDAGTCSSAAFEPKNNWTITDNRIENYGTVGNNSAMYLYGLYNSTVNGNTIIGSNSNSRGIQTDNFSGTISNNNISNTQRHAIQVAGSNNGDITISGNVTSNVSQARPDIEGALMLHETLVLNSTLTIDGNDFGGAGYSIASERAGNITNLTGGTVNIINNTFSANTGYIYHVGIGNLAAISDAFGGTNNYQTADLQTIENDIVHFNDPANNFPINTLDGSTFNDGEAQFGTANGDDNADYSTVVYALWERIATIEVTKYECANTTGLDINEAWRPDKNGNVTADLSNCNLADGYNFGFGVDDGTGQVDMDGFNIDGVSGEDGTGRLSLEININDLDSFDFSGEDAYFFTELDEDGNLMPSNSNDPFNPTDSTDNSLLSFACSADFALGQAGIYDSAEAFPLNNQDVVYCNAYNVEPQDELTTTTFTKYECDANIDQITNFNGENSREGDLFPNQDGTNTPEGDQWINENCNPASGYQFGRNGGESQRPVTSPEWGQTDENGVLVWEEGIAGPGIWDVVEIADDGFSKEESVTNGGDLLGFACTHSNVIDGASNAFPDDNSIFTLQAGDDVYCNVFNVMDEPELPNPTLRVTKYECDLTPDELVMINGQDIGNINNARLAPNNNGSDKFDIKNDIDCDVKEGARFGNYLHLNSDNPAIWQGETDVNGEAVYDFSAGQIPHLVEISEDDTLEQTVANDGDLLGMACSDTIDEAGTIQLVTNGLVLPRLEQGQAIYCNVFNQIVETSDPQSSSSSSSSSSESSESNSSSSSSSQSSSQSSSTSSSTLQSSSSNSKTVTAPIQIKPIRTGGGN